MSRGQVVPAKDITVTWREKELNSERGTLKLEGSEAGEVITSSRKTLSNVCQIIEKVTQVSGTARSLNPITSDDPLPVSVETQLYPYRQLFPRSYTLDDPVGGYKEG